MKKNKDIQEEYDTFSLKSFLILCLRYWKWFLASAVVFVGLALFYIYTRQPVYERSEEILVNDQESGNGVGEVSNSFSNLGLFANQTKVYNELIAFTSPAVIREVVARLDLTMNYNEVKGLRRQNLYGTSMPLAFEFPDISDKKDIGFNIKVRPDGSFSIYKIWIWETDGRGRVKFKDEVSGKVNGAPVKTPVGMIAVKDNPVYFPPEADRTEEAKDVEIEVFRQAEQLAVERYAEMLNGGLVDQDADVISLSIKDTSVERADDFLNTVVEVYNERWINDKNKVAMATSKFISERLEVIQAELDQVDTKIADHKSQMLIPDLEKVAEGFMSQEFMINEELLKATNFLAMTTFLKEYLENPENKFSILPMNTGTENMILEEQIAHYNTALLERNKLAENSSESNPLVRDKDKALTGMRNSIMRSVDSQISNLRNAIKNIAMAQDATREELRDSPQKAKGLLSVERQQLVMDELYLFLLQKREETELTQKFAADNIRVITPPYGNHKPVSPKKKLTVILAFIFGLAIPAGALFLAEASNTKIRSKKDIESLPVPFAGEIPMVGRDTKWTKLFKSKKKKLRDGDKPKIVVEEGKRDIPNEAFRVVRANIDFMLSRTESSVIGLTSFNPGSGKSFIAYNLGVSFAIKGKRVLLIDGDLRHGSISKYVNSPKKGLSTYLSGNLQDWQTALVTAANHPNLSVLPIGHRPPNPAELLESPLLADLLDEARKQYDIVLIDCPPVNIVVDTQIINQYVDRTLFVVRTGLLEKKAIKELETIIGDKKLNNLTLLLNGTKTEFSTYHSYGNYEAIDKS